MNKVKEYDELCKKADYLLTMHNPCKVTDGKCMRGHFCCYECTYLRNNKCSVKSLLCKTWLCQTCIRESLPVLTEGLKDIFLEAWDKNLIVCRGSKKDSLKQINNEQYFKMVIVEMYGTGYKMRAPRKN